MKPLCFSFLLVLPLALAAYDNTWWRTTSIYHTFVWTFKDSNGDGIGDLKGVTSKLDHFVDIGIETIYLSPFYVSPLVDSGYDITDFTGINPVLGSMEQFDELIKETNKRGIKILIDLVINHSSDEHSWFEKSIKRIDPYTNYYIWKDPKGIDESGKPIPPNNWISVFKGSSWQWNEERKQFFYHQFHKKQPDFDLRNEAVLQEILGIMKFWLDKGIGGFRLDAPLFFMEDKEFRDDKKINPDKKEIDSFFDLDHTNTYNLPESRDFTRKLYKYLLKYSNEKGDFERILAGEIYGTIDENRAYYKATHFPFDYWVIRMRYPVMESKILEESVQYWMKSTPKGCAFNWASENHDNRRMADVYGEETSQILMMMNMMLPGISIIFYGEEIGMTSYDVKPERTQDKGISVTSGKGRDLYRLPMSWDDTLNAGFSTKHETWLPVHPNYWQVNVRNQKSRENSRYNIYKTLSTIRKTPTGRNGELKTYVISNPVYAFTRTLAGSETYVTIFNTGTEMEIIDMESIPDLPSTLTVVTGTENSGYKRGDVVNSRFQFPRFFYMRPHSGLVLEAQPLNGNSTRRR